MNAGIEGISLPKFPSFPAKYRDAVEVTAQFGVRGAGHAAKAAAPNIPAAERFELSVRAVNSLDHAVGSAMKLPFAEQVVGSYYSGWKTARRAAEAALMTNLIPAARERYGRAELLESRDEFATGLTRLSGKGLHYRTQAPRELSAASSKRQGLAWLDASIGDAATGAAMLYKVGTGTKLLTQLGLARSTAKFNRPISDKRVATIHELYGSALGELSGRIAAADEAARGASLTAAA